MEPLERLFDYEGNEVCLFPLEFMNVSNPEHQEYAIDFLGWGDFGRVFDCPLYAPFSGSIEYTGNDHNLILWSTNKVRFIDGTLDYATMLVAHSNSAPASVGTTYIQGQLFYHTGNYGVSSGDHVHMEVARGHVLWDQSGLHLENPYHLYNMLAINNTVIIESGGYTWSEYTPTPPIVVSGKRKKFPGVIYARRLREKRSF